MSTTNLTSSTSKRYIVRPLDGPNQVYDNVRADATVGNLKELIFVAEGIPVENQKLIYGSEIMQDHRTLESYYIAQGFVLHLLTVVRPPPYPETTQPPPQAGVDDDQRVLQTVFVKSVNGPNVTMNQVRLVTTVKEFREQYSLKQGQDPEFSRLIYSGKELRDVNDCGVAMTLKDYYVQNESTLHEVFRVPGGCGKYGPGAA